MTEQFKDLQARTKRLDGGGAQRASQGCCAGSCGGGGPTHAPPPSSGGVLALPVGGSPPGLGPPRRPLAPSPRIRYPLLRPSSNASRPQTPPSSGSCGNCTRRRPARLCGASSARAASSRRSSWAGAGGGPTKRCVWGGRGRGGVRGLVRQAGDRLACVTFCACGGHSRHQEEHTHACVRTCGHSTQVPRPGCADRAPPPRAAARLQAVFAAPHGGRAAPPQGASAPGAAHDGGASSMAIYASGDFVYSEGTPAGGDGGNGAVVRAASSGVGGMPVQQGRGALGEEGGAAAEEEEEGSGDGGQASADEPAGAGAEAADGAAAETEERLGAEYETSQDDPGVAQVGCARLWATVLCCGRCARTACAAVQAARLPSTRWPRPGCMRRTDTIRQVRVWLLAHRPSSPQLGERLSQPRYLGALALLCDEAGFLAEDKVWGCGRGDDRQGGRRHSGVWRVKAWPAGLKNTTRCRSRRVGQPGASRRPCQQVRAALL